MGASTLFQTCKISVQIDEKVQHEFDARTMVCNAAITLQMQDSVYDWRAALSQGCSCLCEGALLLTVNMLIDVDVLGVSLVRMLTCPAAPLRMLQWCQSKAASTLALCLRSPEAQCQSIGYVSILSL